MLARKSLSKKRILILGGSMLVIWSIIGIVVYRTFAPSAPEPEPVVVDLPTVIEPGDNQTTGETVADISVEKILRSTELTNLKVFGEVPLEVKVLGRTDPFSSINP